MKLETAEISNFRSIERVIFEEFGGFNVFIGKNNAGKSNILSSLHAFFQCLKEASVVTLSPPIGKEMDFFDKAPHHPIQITMFFSLTTEERDILIEDIALDAPQVKTAVSALNPTKSLAVTLTITPPPTTFGV